MLRISARLLFALFAFAAGCAGGGALTQTAPSAPNGLPLLVPVASPSPFVSAAPAPSPSGAAPSPTPTVLFIVQ